MREMIDLNERGLDPEVVARQAVDDHGLLNALLQGIGPAPKAMPLRENSAGALRWLAASQPALLYPHWDYFVELLSSGNGFSTLPAVHILADLAAVDDAGRFEAAFETFYGLLDDRSVMIASHVAGVSAKIARARPALSAKIVEALLCIEATRHEPGRRELVKSYIIQSLDEIFDLIAKPALVMAFVEDQTASESPKTRKAARAFLKKRSAGSG